MKLFRREAPVYAVREDINLLETHTIKENNDVSIKSNWMVSPEQHHAKVFTKVITGPPPPPWMPNANQNCAIDPNGDQERSMPIKLS